MIIRQRHIMRMDPTNLLLDKFAESRALYQWVDISYDVTDEEGTPILIQSITQEWHTGLDTFSRSTFSSYFEDSSPNLLKQPLQQLQMWFIEI